MCDPRDQSTDGLHEIVQPPGPPATFLRSESGLGGPPDAVTRRLKTLIAASPLLRFVRHPAGNGAML